jgi:hypothetical protein
LTKRPAERGEHLVVGLGYAGGVRGHGSNYRPDIGMSSVQEQSYCILYRVAIH